MLKPGAPEEPKAGIDKQGRPLRVGSCEQEELSGLSLRRPAGACRTPVHLFPLVHVDCVINEVIIVQPEQLPALTPHGLADNAHRLWHALQMQPSEL